MYIICAATGIHYSISPLLRAVLVFVAVGREAFILTRNKLI